MSKRDPQNITIHQFHYTAAPRDAVTNHMRFIRSSLKRGGINGEIFSKEIRGGELTEIRSFTSDQIWNCDLLLIHHSQGNPLLKSLLKMEIPKALIYHNITPPEYFSSDPLLAEMCAKGREQLSLFAEDCSAFFADSKYNLAELTERGMDGELLPLFDLSTLPVAGKARRASTDELRLLFVGKILPHKNQALCLEVVHYLKFYFGVSPLLTLVGGEHPLYGRYLRLLARTLGVNDNVRFAGQISDEDRNVLYRESDLFFCPSLHEGFGIPLVEAMAHELPVFYLPCGAVPETMGDAGIRLLSRKPHEIAAIMATIMNDSSALETIASSLQARIKELSQFQTAHEVLERCRRVVRQQRLGSRAASPSPTQKGKTHAPQASPSPA